MPSARGLVVPAIAVCLITARPSYGCISEPRRHIFDILIDSLAAQTFRDFVLVISDVRRTERADHFEKHPAPIDVRHISPRPSPWLERHKAAICATRNAVFDHVDADLYLWVGDGWSVNPDYLERAWRWYRDHGAFADGLFRGHDNPDVIIDDREKTLPEGQDAMFNVDAFGGCLSREAYEKTGGYDELMDATWGLEDAEMSARLRALGYKTVVECGLCFYTRPMCGHSVFRRPCYTLCSVAMAYLKYDRIAKGDFGVNRPMTDSERRRFLPECCHLTEDDGCRLYPGSPPCSQHHARRPDPNDPDVRLALGMP